MLAGTAGLFGLHPRPVAAEPPPETTTLRLMEAPALCFAPEYVAAALLRSEGFHTVQYVKTGGGAGTMKALAAGNIDLAMTTAPIFAIQVDAGDPILMLAGVHGGRYELFGTSRVRAIRDLRGKTVAVQALGAGWRFLDALKKELKG
jgi:NitT/TauT family transport system substrate-binding protein